MQIVFRKGEIYNRRLDIHRRYKGQERGGIITPTSHPLVLIVSGKSGRQHGYEDYWSDDHRTFFYYGEGQVGDMRFKGGNLALRDHVVNGEDIHLFQEVPRRDGYLRYFGQMICIGYEWVEAPDRNKSLRRALLFELSPIELFNDDVETKGVEELRGEPSGLEDLRRRAMDDAVDALTPTERLEKYIKRSFAIKAYVLARAAGKCEACGKDAPFRTRAGTPYLEPHHIRRLSDGGPDHPQWVLGVCPNCHRRAHYSEDGPLFNQRLGDIVLRLEPPS
jgi:5-methylcytosine-specific restriction enzyme A